MRTVDIGTARVGPVAPFLATVHRLPNIHGFEGVCLQTTDRHGRLRPTLR